MAKLANSLVKSTCLWLLPMLLLLNCCAGLLRSLRSVPHSQLHPLQLATSAITFKIDRFRQMRTPPDIVVLGSSLPMCALYYSEGELFDRSVESAAKRDGVNGFQAYTEAHFLENLIRSRLHRSLRIFNFTTAACMASDADLILSRILYGAQKPKVILYGVGLRDFIDNINPPYGQTPVFHVLCDLGYLAENQPAISHPGL